VNGPFNHHQGEGQQWQKRQRKGQPSLGHELQHKGVADTRLATPSSAVKEKDLSLVIVHRVHDLVEFHPLLIIEVRIVIIDHGHHLIWVIIQLLLENGVGNQDIPLLLWKGHVRIVCEKLSGLYEDVLEEVKSIVKDITLCGIQMPLSNEAVLQVITYLDLVFNARGYEVEWDDNARG
jgi:hypothetical protein